MKNISRIIALFGLLAASVSPALANNSVSQDQDLDKNLGILGSSWDIPSPPPIGGAVAPTQVKPGLPPYQQQPMVPPPQVPIVRRPT